MGRIFVLVGPDLPASYRGKSCSCLFDQTGWNPQVEAHCMSLSITLIGMEIYPRTMRTAMSNATRLRALSR